MNKINVTASRIIRRGLMAKYKGRASGPPSMQQSSPLLGVTVLDYVVLAVKKAGNRLQHRLKSQPLTHQLPIGKTDLPLLCRDRN